MANCSTTGRRLLAKLNPKRHARHRTEILIFWARWRLWKMSARRQTEVVGETLPRFAAQGRTVLFGPQRWRPGPNPEPTAGTVLALTGCTRLPDAGAILRVASPLASSRAVQLYP
jgi:hypothetical protein